MPDCRASPQGKPTPHNVRRWLDSSARPSRRQKRPLPTGYPLARNNPSNWCQYTMFPPNCPRRCLLQNSARNNPRPLRRCPGRSHRRIGRALKIIRIQSPSRRDHKGRCRHVRVEAAVIDFVSECIRAVEPRLGRVAKRTIRVEAEPCRWPARSPAPQSTFFRPRQCHCLRRLGRPRSRPNSRLWRKHHQPLAGELRRGCNPLQHLLTTVPTRTLTPPLKKR